MLGLCRLSGGSCRYSRSLPSHVLRGRAVWLALTFLRSASCGRSAGSNYCLSGSWPCGECALAPLNHLFPAFGRRLHRQAIVSTSRSTFSEGWLPRLPFALPGIRAPCVLLPVIRLRTSVGDTLRCYSVPARPWPLRCGLGSLWPVIMFAMENARGIPLRLSVAGGLPELYLRQLKMRLHRQCCHDNPSACLVRGRVEICVSRSKYYPTLTTRHEYNLAAVKADRCQS